MKKILLSIMLVLIPVAMKCAETIPPKDAPKITLGVTPGVEFDLDLVGQETEEITVWIVSDGKTSTFQIPQGVEEAQTLKLYTANDNRIAIYGNFSGISLVDAEGLTLLDASGNSAIRKINLYQSFISTVKLDGCTHLDYLSMDECGTSSLSLKGCSALTELSCVKNEIGA